MSRTGSGGQRAPGTTGLSGDAQPSGMPEIPGGQQGSGGFTDMDDTPSIAQLEKWTKNGELRYIPGSDDSRGAGMGAPGTTGGAAEKRSKWISENCAKVPASTYGGSTSSQQDNGTAMPIGGGTVLYDCAAR